MKFKKDALLNQLEKFTKRPDFEKYVNIRSFEMDILEISKQIEIEDCEDLVKDLEVFIAENKIDIAFCLFFVLFTKFRRNKVGNLVEFSEKYIHEFYDYKISEFLMILAQMSEVFEEKNYLKYMKKVDKLIHSSGENYDFSNHSGILNCYVELVCLYFETQLDDRYDEDLQGYLQTARNTVENLIKDCPEGKVYPKYYLNKGRILVLLEKYREGNKFISTAIHSLPSGPEREKTVRDYEQYIQKSNMIRSYDMTSNKIKELNNIKTDNTKALALMTTLLGFLLGSINIFAQVSDAFTLGMLMLCYLGLLLILTGVVFVGLNLASKKGKMRFVLYDFIILAVGIAVFVTTMIIVLKH